MEIPFEDAEPIVNFVARVAVDGRAVLVGTTREPFMWLAGPFEGADLVCVCYDTREYIDFVAASRTMESVRPLVERYSRFGRHAQAREIEQ